MSELTLDDVEFVTGDDDEYSEQFTGREEARDPDAKFVEEKKETPRARKYRLKVKHGLNFVMRGLAGNSATVSDAAAIVHYGPGVSQAIGNLCDQDDRARRIVDFVTDDTLDNPWAAVAVTAIPLAIQLLRNHEGTTVPLPTGLRIPFTQRRINLKFPKFTLNVGRLKQVSYEPSFLADHIFGNPAIREALTKQGVNVAWPAANANGYAGNGAKHARS